MESVEFIVSDGAHNQEATALKILYSRFCVLVLVMAIYIPIVQLYTSHLSFPLSIYIQQ